MAPPSPADAPTEVATWLGRFRDAQPIRRTGAFHLVSCAEARGERRLVVLGAAEADPRGVAARLDEVAQTLALLDHPAIPRPAPRARGRMGDIEYLALACDAVTDLADLLARWRHNSALPTLPRGGLSSLYERLAGALAAAHATADPRTGEPLCVGTFGWENVLVGAAGEVYLLGFGGCFCFRDEFGRPIPGLRPLRAPEVVFGQRPTPASDIYGLAALMSELLSLVQPPAAMQRLVAGQGEPADAAVMEAMMNATRGTLAPSPDDRFETIEATLEAQRAIWTSLGVTPDPVALRAALAAAATGREQPPADEELQDLQQGRYQVDRFLGSGAVGAVFLARDRALQQAIALKVVDARRHPHLRGRFSREVRILRTIHHPHLVRGFDLFEESGRLVAVMEYVDGLELRAHFAEELDLASVCARVREVAEALSALHQRRLVHRDIKPANIVVNARRGAVLVDLGVAADENASRGLTHTGALLGTLRYMAPEQLAGRNASAGSDIFALAVVLLEVVYGDRGFTDDGRPLTDGLRGWLEDPAIEPRLPASLRDLLVGCLHSDPTARPGAAALARRLLEVELELRSPLTRRR